jgi:lipoprotein NlpD
VATRSPELGRRLLALALFLPIACAGATPGVDAARTGTVAPAASAATTQQPGAAAARPGTSTHVVRAGETLRQLARLYATTVAELVVLNRLGDANQIRVGQRLVVPRPSEGATPAPPPSPPPAAASPHASPKPAPSPAPAVGDADGLDENVLDAALARLDTPRRGSSPRAVEPLATPAPTAAPTAPGSTPAPPESTRRGPSGTSTDAVDPRSLRARTEAPAPAPDALVAERALLPASPHAGKAPLVWPVDGVVVALFGSKDGARHDGVDIAAPLGTAVWAAADGRVIYVGEQPGYGKLVILAHGDERLTVYAHNATNLVRVGEELRQGEPIAQVGQTGTMSIPGVHFELRVRDKPTNPLPLLPQDL